MASTKVILAALALVLVLSVKPYEAARILDEEEELWMKREQELLLTSLPRGDPTGPPAPNGCTWIPGGGGRPCAASISQRNFAATASPPPPPQVIEGAYPKQMVQFGVASRSK